jgi:hypothetical protein
MRLVVDSDGYLAALRVRGYAIEAPDDGASSSAAGDAR